MAYYIPMKKSKEKIEVNDSFIVKKEKQDPKKLFLEELKKKDTISESEILLVKRRLNEGTYKNEDLGEEFYEKSLTPEQNEKGITYLRNKAFKKNGEKKSNSPFGIMEDEKIKTFETFEFAGYQDIGNYGFKNYVPIYRVVSKEGTFEYYIQGGEVKIIG